MILKLLCCFVLIFGGNMSTNTDSIFNHISNTNEIVVFDAGSKQSFQRGDDKFELILNAFLNTIKTANEMPAFGVSLDNETQQALKSGLWIEFCFDTTQSYNDMPFDSLLISVNAEDSGINLIRKHNHKYDGRCFYLNLKTNLKALSSIVCDLCKQ